MHGRPWTAAIVVGLVAGALSSLGQPHLDGTLHALVNSISSWLVAPFVVGTLAATRREAAAVGFSTCAALLAGYYAITPLWDFETSRSLVAFWVACAVAGGPVFGMAGHLWRTGSSRVCGLGIATLAGAFVAEGLYAYGHELQQYVTAAVWVGIGVALALLASRGRVEQLRWLGLTVPVGVGGEIVLTTILHRAF